MKISAKAEYGCLAILELALNHGLGEPVQARRIAQTHGIPQGFLVQILLQLKAAGLVTSARGAAGGYRLARSPESICLADVLEAIDGSHRLDYDADPTAPAPLLHLLRSVWCQVDQAAEEVLSRTSLADLIDRAGVEQPVVGDWI